MSLQLQTLSLQDVLTDKEASAKCMVQTQQWQEVQLQHEEEHLPYLAYMRTLRVLDPHFLSQFDDWLAECAEQPQLPVFCPILWGILQRIQNNWRFMDPDTALHPWRHEFHIQPLGHQYLRLVTEGSNSLSRKRRSSRKPHRAQSDRASRSSSAAELLPSASLPPAYRQLAADFTNQSSYTLSTTLSEDVDVASGIHAAMTGQHGATRFDHSSGHMDAMQGGQLNLHPPQQHSLQLPLFADLQQQDQHVHGQNDGQLIYNQPGPSQLHGLGLMDPADLLVSSWDWHASKVRAALQQHRLEAQRIQHMLDSLHEVRLLLLGVVYHLQTALARAVLSNICRHAQQQVCRPLLLGLLIGVAALQV